MATRLELDAVTFRCTHSHCGEIFEKSLTELAGAVEAYCPRCGTAADDGDNNHLQANSWSSKKSA